MGEDVGEMMKASKKWKSRSLRRPSRNPAKARVPRRRSDYPRSPSKEATVTREEEEGITRRRKTIKKKGRRQAEKGEDEE